MIQVVIIGHGSYATGVKGNLEMVAGIPEYMHFLDFALGQEKEELEQNLEELLRRLGEQPVLFCCDLPGATPFQTAAIKAAQNPQKYRVVAGLNAMAFMEMAMGMEEEDTLREIAERAVNTTKEAVMTFPE